MTAFSPGASPPPVVIAMRMVSGTGQPRRGDEGEDLARLGVMPGLRLLEDRRAVHHDFEAPAARGDERHLGVRVLRLELRRQTGGAWFVVSDRAVFDRDLHGSLECAPDARERCPAPDRDDGRTPCRGEYTVPPPAREGSCAPATHCTELLTVAAFAAAHHRHRRTATARRARPGARARRGHRDRERPRRRARRRAALGDARHRPLRHARRRRAGDRRAGHAARAPLRGRARRRLPARRATA